MKDKNKRAKVARQKVLLQRERVRKQQKEDREKERLLRISRPKQAPAIRNFTFGEEKVLPTKDKFLNEDIVKGNLQKCQELLEAFDEEVKQRKIRRQQIMMAQVEKENDSQEELINKVITQEMIDENGNS